MAKGKGKLIMNSTVVAMSVVIMVVISALIVGSILDNDTFTQTTGTATVTNESGAYINSTGYTLDGASDDGFTSPSISAVYNNSDGILIGSGNYTVSGAGILTNATATTWSDVNVSYTYTRNVGTSLAGINSTEIKNDFGDFVTNLIAFLAVIGTILGVVWLVLYVKKLFDKKEGIQGITA